ncbi:MAG: hypothetical protein K8I02_05450, partial [Candidatus Methylomirabilis sp.]|nr:hypothetical protein [Deltaproteobacteria bacterium]
METYVKLTCRARNPYAILRSLRRVNIRPRDAETSSARTAGPARGSIVIAERFFTDLDAAARRLGVSREALE